MYHVYSLPPQLLQTLTPRNLISQPEPEVPKEQPSSTIIATSTGLRTCNVCLGISFADVDQQRAHFRSDWHRYNVKSKLNGSQPVAEQDFNQLLDALEDSLSGSESSQDDDESSNEDAVEALVKKHRQQRLESSEELSSPNLPQSPIAWFHSPPDTQLGIYRTLFPLGTPQTSYLNALENLQRKSPTGRKWAMFMVAGGHFAGAIVRVSRPEQEEEEQKMTKKPKAPKPLNEVLLHKTFHRYTTRRKQGGSQSTNDNAKGPAKSAGAQLRRYGEQALRDDIRNLLTTWADEINDCELIFIRANVSNRRIFMDYEECVIEKGDDRLRTFPFPTRRPTQSEVTRCLNELTNAKITRFTEAALREQDEEYLASLPKPKPKPTPASKIQPEKPKPPQPPKLTAEEEQLRERWDRLIEMIVKGRLEALKSFWAREAIHLGQSTTAGIDIRVPVWADRGGNERAVTLLQIAAHAGQDNVVAWLLEDMHADPTIPGSVSEEDTSEEEKSSRQVAYDMSQNKATRDAFRRCAASHPDWWDWLGAAHLPSALHKEMEDERDEKRKVKRKGLKDRIREREAKDKPEEVRVEPVRKVAVMPPPTTGPQKLGGASGDVQGLAGLTPEMRARIERERRARAAEARFAKVNGN